MNSLGLRNLLGVPFTISCKTWLSCCKSVFLNIVFTRHVLFSHDFDLTSFCNHLNPNWECYCFDNFIWGILGCAIMKRKEQTIFTFYSYRNLLLRNGKGALRRKSAVWLNLLFWYNVTKYDLTSEATHLYNFSDRRVRRAPPSIHSFWK